MYLFVMKPYMFECLFVYFIQLYVMNPSSLELCILHRVFKSYGPCHRSWTSAWSGYSDEMI